MTALIMCHPFLGDSLTVQKSSCRGQLSIASAGHKDMSISAGLGKSKLEARGGIVGGHIDMTALNASSTYGTHSTMSCIDLYHLLIYIVDGSFQILNLFYNCHRGETFTYWPSAIYVVVRPVIGQC